MTCLQAENKTQVFVVAKKWGGREGGQCPAPRALPATLSAARGGAGVARWREAGGGQPWP